MKTQIQQQDTDKEIFDLIMTGISAWTKAAEKIRVKMSEDSEWVARFVEDHPQFSEASMVAFSRIGQKYIPILSFATQPGAVALRKLPIEVQRQYADSPVDVLVPDGDSWSSMKISVFNMTCLQRDQVFAADHIRDASEQRAWLKSMEAQITADKSIKKSTPPYEIRGKYLIIHEPDIKIHVREVAALLSRAEC